MIPYYKCNWIFTQKIAIKDLLENNKIKLTQTDKVLEQVKVFASLKGDHRNLVITGNGK